MGTVVVGFVPGPRGEAALQHAVEECRRRGARLVVVNTSRGDSLVDERFLQGEDLERLEADLAVAGVPAELRRPMRGRDVAELERDARAGEVVRRPLVRRRVDLDGVDERARHLGGDGERG